MGRVVEETLHSMGWRRRLRQVAQTIAGPVAYEHLPGGTANGMGVRVQHDPTTGTITKQSLDRLREMKRSAVLTEDYSRAAHLQRLERALDPALRLATEDCAPPTPEGQIECFHKNGFVILHSVLEGANLARAQRVWMSLMEPQWSEWEARRAEHMAAGRWQAVRFFDLKGLMEADEELWIDLMDSPKFRPCATRFAGGGGFEGEVGAGQEHYHGVARVSGVGGRVVPPDTDTRYSEAPLGYGGWHRDIPPPDGYPLPGPRHIKAWVYLWDVPRECAALMVVPQSHRLPDGPTQTLDARFTNGRNPRRNEGELPMGAFPNHVAVSVPAGSAVMFDSAIWHGVMPNSSVRPRCSVTLGFSSSRRNSGCTVRRPPPRIENPSATTTVT